MRLKFTNSRSTLTVFHQHDHVHVKTTLRYAVVWLLYEQVFLSLKTSYGTRCIDYVWYFKKCTPSVITINITTYLIIYLVNSARRPRVHCSVSILETH